MPITTAELKFFLSGGAANADPNASLGGAKSSVEWTGGVVHDLFDVITGDENAGSDVEYRLIYVQNTDPALTWIEPKAWFSAVVAGGADIAMALAGEGKNIAAETIVDENTAPAGEVFSTPTTKAGGLSLPDLEDGDYHGIWLRRTATNSAAMANDGATLRIEGDTEA